MKAPTTARFPWFSISAKLDHNDTCKSAIGVRFMAAMIFGNGLLGVRLLNDGGCRSGTRDKY